MQRRAVAVESHVDVGTMLQVVPKQVHLPVARRRVERHGAYQTRVTHHGSPGHKKTESGRVVARTVAIRDGARERLQAR